MTGRELLLKAIHNEPKDAPATGLECIVSGPRLEEVRALLADLIEKEG